MQERNVSVIIMLADIMEKEGRVKKKNTFSY